MTKFHDILYMVVGLGAVAVGVIQGGRLTVIGLAGLAILIFFGARAILQIRKEHRALKSETLRDPAVMEFYRRTKKMWAEGRLDEAAPLRRKEGAKSLEWLIRRYAPYETSALDAMFRQFPPEGDEYLVHEANDEKTYGGGWFVLTNKRLILRDGASGKFGAVRFSDIESFESKGTMSRKFSFKLKNGKTVEFSKVKIFPTAKWIDKLRSGWPDKQGVSSTP